MKRMPESRATPRVVGRIARRDAAPLIALAVVVGTIACVVPPARRAPELVVEVPAAWSVPANAADDPIDAWWTTFDAPGLERVIDEALAHNTDLVAAAARVARAEAEARIAGAELKPSLGAGVSGSRQRQVFVGLPIPGDTVPSATYTTFGVSLDASWEVDLWGRIRASARAALADAQAGEADLHAARLSIAAQTAKAWFAAVEARQQIELTERSAESFARLAAQIRERYRVGTRPAIDLRLALSNAAAAEAQLRQRRRRLDATLRQLEVLLGRYPSARLLDEIPLDRPSDMPPPVPAGLPAELIGRRPDLVAAERRAVAADQRLRAARAALYPRLSLTGGGGTVSDQLSDLLDGDFRTWNLVGNLVQPLFEGGRLRAGVERAAAAGDELLASYAGAVLRAFAEVESALAADTLLAEQQASQAEAVEQLLAAESLAEDRYRRGIGDYLTVLESQTRAFTSQSALLALGRERLDNRIDLHLALGGGFAEGNPR